jgi:hypothetical protein
MQTKLSAIWSYIFVDMKAVSIVISAVTLDCLLNVKASSKQRKIWLRFTDLTEKSC